MMETKNKVCLVKWISSNLKTLHERFVLLKFHREKFETLVQNKSSLKYAEMDNFFFFIEQTLFF